MRPGPEREPVIDGSARVSGWRVPDRERDRLLALHRVSTLVAQQRQTDDVLREALKSAVELVGADAGSVHRWLPDAERLRCVIAHGQAEPLVRQDLRPGEGVTGQTFVAQTPMILNDYQASNVGTTVSRAAGLRSAVAVPIASGAHRRGILSVGSYDEHRTFDQQDAQLLELFASIVAVAWENAELYSELETRLARIRALNAMVRLVSDSLDLDYILPRIAEAAVQLTGAALAVFWLADEAHQVVRLAGVSDQRLAALLDQRQIRYGEGAAGFVAQRREPLNIDDVLADGRSQNLDLWRLTGMTSSLTLPVLHGTSLVAVLSMAGPKPFRLDVADSEVVEGFLGQAAAAIRNASLFSSVRRSQEQLQQIIDHSPATISLKDGHGRYLLTNRRWRQRFLADDGTVDERGPLGRTDADLFPPNRASETRAHDLDVLTTGRPVEYETTIVEHGERRTYLTVKFPLTGGDGQPYAVCTIATDITFRKESEEEMAAALAAQRDANTQLEELSRAKSDFVSIVSHDFRSPLTSIQGFSELIHAGNLSKQEMQEYAGDIYREAERLQRMIAVLLDLDQLEAGRMNLQISQVDLCATLEQVAATIGRQSQRHVITLNLDSALAAVPGDADRLTQVLINLLDNAIKYSPDGGEIAIAGWIEGAHARLRIQDQGLGIPPEALEHIFERYRRLPLAEQHRTIRGTGLGLPIVRQIVELHRGNVWAESTPGHGSTFHVRLPLDETSEAAGS
ncbi:MAG: DUF484 family protein [Chloroflexi bacterium]|nr:DUF484 family protein [Chloroflexota bacterium]